MATPSPHTPVSPKLGKIKAAQKGVPLFGCEHVERMLTRTKDSAPITIDSYKKALRVVLNAPVIAHTTENAKKKECPRVTLTPHYLCIQCDSTLRLQDRLKHGTEKSHRFYVESRSGALYCQMCDDFVWDPTLEELRTRKCVTGSFSTKPKKRKLDEMLADPVKEDARFISINTSEAPCESTGIRGIYNMGATCYMNVILQSLVHNPLLRNYYLGEGHQREGCQVSHCMSCAMDAMFQDFYMTDDSKGFDTRGFQAAGILGSFYLSKRKAYEELASNKEQDAHEFFQFLTEELHEINGGTRSDNSDENSSPTKANISNDPGCQCIIHQTFYGKLQSTITCRNCGHVNASVQSFLDLSLGLESLSKKKNLKATNFSIQRCLDEEYSSPERCDYNCHKCHTSDSIRQLSIKSLPNVLCIQLKRFSQSLNGASKIPTKVSFPLKLEMLPYTNRAKTQDTRKAYELARSCTYDLQSVIVHVGKIDSGHYVSYSRVGNQWFKFNDHNVKLATKSQVLNEQAFLLFYVIQALA